MFYKATETSVRFQGGYRTPSTAKQREGLKAKIEYVAEKIGNINLRRRTKIFFRLTILGGNARK